jgi:hypothetical protein
MCVHAGGQTQVKKATAWASGVLEQTIYTHTLV